MNHKMAVPFLKVAKTAWESESQWETYLAVAAGVVGVAILAREANDVRRILRG